MKELSIEEKAKAYDGNYKAYTELINRLEDVKDAIKNQNYGIAMDILYKPYPEFQITTSTELKESEDERIRKAIHIYLDWLDGRKDYAPKGEYSIRDMIAWLEKQGEHANFLSKIQVGDKVTRNEDGVLVNLSQLKRVAKPADKVEPKFKVGDWVVTKDGKVNQVKTVSDDGDAYELDDDTYFSGSWKDIYHLWTIQDAKDGDVLAVEGYHSPFVAICKKQNEESFDSYCFIGFDGNFYKAVNGHDAERVHPATKEQCDLLFQKMKETGYEWDTDTKELKKIEHNPADTEKGANGNEREIPNSAWSEEDEAIYYGVIETEQYMLDVVNGIKEFDVGNISIKKECTRELNWLKSIKDRYAWKPSDEQMKWFGDVLDYHQFSSEGQKIMQSLYDDLKKLKE